MIQSGSLPGILKSKGRSMPRKKYQRPEVHAAGRREKLWRAEWREYYIDPQGNQRSRHKSKTWCRQRFTKTEAQAELDRILRDLQQGGRKADGTMSLKAFWEEIYFPVQSARWEPNTRNSVGYQWRKLEPLWSKPLNEITKSVIDLHLLKLASSGLGASSVEGVMVRIHAVLEEALENDFIAKNPARKVELPKCKAKVETRSLTEVEVRRLWDSTTGREYVIWRLLLLTGARISEILALNRDDLVPDGLRIDESAYNAAAGPTKNKKTRVAPLPPTLRGELEEWLRSHDNHLMFTSPGGKMLRRNDIYVRGIQTAARDAAKISDLTYRMCRTTFATLFEGDIKDAQAILGHHSPAFTLQVYRKPITSRQQGAVDAMDQRLRSVVEIRRAG